jgi:DNA modification methylase
MINNLLNIVQNQINNESFKYYDMIILDVANINFEEEPIENISKILSLMSYIIKPGGNVIIINNNSNDIYLHELLQHKLFWRYNKEIIVKSKLIDDELNQEYIPILCYSNNFRTKDPEPTYNKFEDISNLWLTVSKNELYRRIVKMFSNENDTIFDPCMNNDLVNNICKELNRNYIGIKDNDGI